MNISDEDLMYSVQPGRSVAQGGIFVGILLGILVVGSIIGNSLVILTVKWTPALQTHANYLICSLAFTDLLVALLVMPFGALYLVSGKWSLGQVFCQIWSSIDIAFCTASILHLCAIALERQHGVANPVAYFAKKHTSKLLPKITLIWLLSLIISLPPLMGWQDYDDDVSMAGTIGNTTQECKVKHHPGYTVYATMSSFYIPLALLLLVYCRVYIAIHKQINRSKLRSNSPYTSPSPKIHESKFRTNRRKKMDGFTTEVNKKRVVVMDTEQGCNDSAQSSANASPNNADTWKRLHRAYGRSVSCNVDYKLNIPTSTNPHALGMYNVSIDSFNSAQSNETKAAMGDSNQLEKKVHRLFKHRRSSAFILPSILNTKFKARPRKIAVRVTRSGSMLISNHAKYKLKVLKAREIRAIGTLGTIVGAFVVCWLPFFIVTITKPFCDCNIPETVHGIVLWLGYCNSLMNPIIYTLFNSDFNKALKNIHRQKNRSCFL